ncbi:MAG: putative aldolase, partial [Pseudomonadota bacterium]
MPRSIRFGDYVQAITVDSDEIAYSKLMSRPLFDQQGNEVPQKPEKLRLGGMDVYKAEVPFGGKASDDEMKRVYDQMHDAIGIPWVVLSNGVAKEDFERAVSLACKSGAKGFLAGRAVWADVVGG